MTTYELQAGMPTLPLAPGMMWKLEAISPTTGAAITGVKVSAVGMQAAGLAGLGGPGVNVQVGPFMFVPGPEA